MVVVDCCLAQDRPSRADSLVVTGDPNLDGTLFDTLDFRVAICLGCPWGLGRSECQKYLFQGFYLVDIDEVSLG
jgi:hypothetical protein